LITFSWDKIHYFGNGVRWLNIGSDNGIKFSPFFSDLSSGDRPPGYIIYSKEANMSDSNMPEISPDGKKAVIAIGSAAAAGAVIGSFVPVVGTVFGAGFGGILGGIGIIVGAIMKKSEG
jgi:hypothetical protein